MEQYIKNMERGAALEFASLVQYAEGQVVSRTLAQNDHVSLTLFAFAKGEEISSHASDGDALVIALEGEGRVTIDGQPHQLQAGASILMPAKKPHAIFATEQFKMFLAVVFPES
ncbi:cupin domain-containing protein [Ruminococcaceae bacterium OttesenSCG-928-D13]|nr:cupin domain-containing protein [Ruminococcaceae bacterium OttesenSCG-928-D13]